MKALVEEKDDITLLGVIRTLHLKIHLHNLDEAAEHVGQSPVKARRGDLLESKLIVHSCLEFLKDHGQEQFENFINNTMLRLVSTVHPNETERSTNLIHYSVILDKFIAWKKDLESVSELPKFAPEYRIRRENLNHMRRNIKAEIEGVWQVRTFPSSFFQTIETCPFLGFYACLKTITSGSSPNTRLTDHVML